MAAVGRGGVLDLAHRYAHPDDVLTLDTIHRFVRLGDTGEQVPDRDYADLTVAMRSGHDPAAVFDALHGRGQIVLRGDIGEQIAAAADLVADHATTGGQVGQIAVVVDTREQVAAVNAAVRERLVNAGTVDDTAVVVTGSGERIGLGDRVATRRNDPTLAVANRDTWTVTHVTPDPDTSSNLVTSSPAASSGSLTVIDTAGRTRVLPPEYVRAYVELAYSSTAYGVQGDTTTAAHLLVGEHTNAASAYVAMTRGREANTAHLIAADIEEARAVWVAVFARDRADLGPADAARTGRGTSCWLRRTRPRRTYRTDGPCRDRSGPGRSDRSPAGRAGWPPAGALRRFGSRSFEGWKLPTELLKARRIIAGREPIRHVALLWKVGQVDDPHVRGDWREVGGHVDGVNRALFVVVRDDEHRSAGEVCV